MNYFGHAAVASWYSNDPGFVLGSMLPDFANMLGLRLGQARSEPVRSGVAFHHRTDQVFHDTASFRSLSKAALQELLDGGLGRGSARAVAHVGVEMLIDGVLAEEPRARSSYRQALERSGRDELGAQLVWVADDPGRALAGFEELRAILLAYGVAADNIAPAQLAQRLSRTLAHRPRMALDEAGRVLVMEWAARAEPHVRAAVPTLVAELAAALSAEGTPLPGTRGSQALT